MPVYTFARANRECWKRTSDGSVYIVTGITGPAGANNIIRVEFFYWDKSSNTISTDAIPISGSSINLLPWDDYASSIDLHQITVWDQCPNLLDFVHNQLATNPYEIPADILVSINSFKAAYDARRLAQTQIVPQLAAATGPVVYSWTSPILTPVAPTYNLTTGVLTLGTPKAKHKIPENANRDICKECGRKTKEVALFTTTTHYCPDCE